MTKAELKEFLDEKAEFYENLVFFGNRPHSNSPSIFKKRGYRNQCFLNGNDSLGQS